jgi:hypothetical protein
VIPLAIVDTEGRISSTLIVVAGIVIVVMADNVQGGKTNAHGGRHVTVGDAEE